MSKLPPDLILELPDWSTTEEQPALTLAEIVAICEKMLPIWNAERFKSEPPPLSCLPFVLDDVVNTVPSGGPTKG